MVNVGLYWWPGYTLSEGWCVEYVGSITLERPNGSYQTFLVCYRLNNRKVWFRSVGFSSKNDVVNVVGLYWWPGYTLSEGWCVEHVCSNYTD